MDASQGTSECLRVKRKSFPKKKKKKRPSSRNSGTMEGTESEEPKSVKRGSDASQESSECLGVKCKRVKKKKKKRATSVQRTTAIKSNRIDKELASRLKGCIDVALRRKKRASSLSDVLEPIRLRHAKRALEFYGKSHQDAAEFEVVEVVDISSSIMRHPDFDRGHLCCHASFIAKPKKDDCNVSPKHFLAEFFKDHYGKFQFTYCDIFEPSDDPGFNHGCLICSPAQRFHPSDGYSFGRPPWHKAARVFR